ncbi:hypothetical protein [Stigmatella erecta]|uniref:Uncharacterized protein n=1 Tax=Stigmatella erecta TaxID=83460 RepID=A0A1I0CZA3_9BACT|nr:hypothetical protein [Stigmatella erecta]SET25210.1 hypothetical protein SAMN05443639_102317 [Stigmatella erecta]
MPSPSRALSALPLVELGGLLLVALLCLVFQLRLPGRLPTEADHRAVATYLQAQLRPGDAVLLFPWWTERARLFVPPEVPVYGYWGSDREDLREHPRLWVLAQPELPRADAAAFQEAFLPGRTVAGEAFQAGPLTLTPYTNGRYRPRRWSALQAFATARVYLESPEGQRQPCPFNGQAYRCPGAPHLYMAPEWHEFHYAPRRCLWMHPPGGAGRLVAEFDGVPGGTGLRLEGGLIAEAAVRKSPALSPTLMGVDDAQTHERLLEIALPPGLEGVQQAERTLPPGEPRTVKIWTQATRAESRQVCLDVAALGPAGGGT